MDSSYNLNSETCLISEVDNKRVIQLNRPNVMNAFDGHMIIKMQQCLESWNKDPNVDLVIIKGNHKAFCSGGDVLDLTGAAKKGDITRYKNFIKLMHSVKSFSKPYIALIDGLTMGGGCGLALNGPFVVATERTLLSMPETSIGFYPDSGSAHFFKGNFGLFLGLTGFRLKGADVFHAGLATHYASFI
uniref:3-hydroxyisobutyryl-CoA hydrolase, mitochondrial n=1 Tax=Acrobeloides nanus TaxID=290746 RepID=A0A914C4M4_9BILA